MLKSHVKYLNTVYPAVTWRMAVGWATAMTLFGSATFVAYNGATYPSWLPVASIAMLFGWLLLITVTGVFWLRLKVRADVVGAGNGVVFRAERGELTEAASRKIMSFAIFATHQDVIALLLKRLRRVMVIPSRGEIPLIFITIKAQGVFGDVETTTLDQLGQEARSRVNGIHPYCWRNLYWGGQPEKAETAARTEVVRAILSVCGERNEEQQRRIMMLADIKKFPFFAP